MLFLNIDFSFFQYSTSWQNEKDLKKNLFRDLFCNVYICFHFQIYKLNFEKSFFGKKNSQKILNSCMSYLICLSFALAKFVSNICFHTKQYEKITKFIHMIPMNHNKVTISFNWFTELFCYGRNIGFYILLCFIFLN